MIDYDIIRYTPEELKEFTDKYCRKKNPHSPNAAMRRKAPVRFLREEGRYDEAERYELRHDDMEVGQ